MDRATLAQLRIRSLAKIKEGTSPEEIAKILGFNRSTVYRWIEKYNISGNDALKVHKAPGKKPRLNAKQLQILRKTIIDKTPEQLKFSFVLWTRELIRQFISDKFDVELSRVSVGRVLASIGLTFQKPLHRAYQQNESLVNSWRNKDYPKIQKMAKKEGAEIYFGDEAGMRSDHHSGKTWGEKGHTPIIKTTGARFGVNLISAISPKGSLKFMFTKGKVNSEVFIDFLCRLIKYQRKIIYLIVDGHPTHKSKAVNKFIDNNKKKIKLFILPSYSPQLNPDELVWNIMKNEVGRQSISGPDDLANKVNNCLTNLSNNIEKVVSLFREKNVSYILNNVA